MKWLSGYRTIISILISGILKVLALKGWINGDTDAAALTDQILLVVSGIFDLVSIFFRMRASTPGVLAPAEAKANWKPPTKPPNHAPDPGKDPSVDS
jgi:hypothetical protein